MLRMYLLIWTRTLLTDASWWVTAVIHGLIACHSLSLW